jgi:hypothetical protein
MEESKNNKKSINTIIGLAVGLIAFFLIKQFVFAPPSFDKVMMKAASEMNESCPIMVDQNTRLDNAVALPGNILQYNYTLVSWIRDSIDIAAFNEYMFPMILNNIKTNPELKVYRDNKTTMAYSYKDMNGEFISKISITAHQYLDED